MKATHGYAPGHIDGFSSDGRRAVTLRLTCLCGHVELVEDDFSGALDRMNKHVRGAYTDEEWEKLMSETKLALLDSKTGDLKMPDEGPKS